MSKSSIVIRDSEESHRLVFSSRDWGLLWGPFFDEGRVFINAFGVYEHFTVAGGIPDGSRVTRQRRVLQNATRALLAGIERDAELLRYDYSYGFSTDTSRHGGAQGIGVRGLSGIVSTRPHGYCFLKLVRAIDGGQRRLAEFIDLRVVVSVETDTCGILKVHRRKAEMHWLESLPPLLEFLRARSSQELLVEHYDRVAS